MRTVTLVVTLIVTIAAATLLFYFFQHQLSGIWLDMTLRPEVRDALEKSLADQKKLYTADPEHAAEYRRRFELLRTLIGRIEVLQLSRQEMTARYEFLLVGIFAVSLLVAGAIAMLRHRRNERRLVAIQGGLEALSRGEQSVAVGDRRRDPIGRIGRMIESTARMVSGQRRRLDYLEHLSSWQEAARRHAHEIRTPLTAARLEVDRLASMARANAPEGELDRVKESVFQELDRLSRFTREFSSFATISVPTLREEPLGPVIEEFCHTFAKAWPSLTLHTAALPPARARVDRDLLRQVLVNLCTNSSRAGATTVDFTITADRERVLLDVSDDGAGVPAAIRTRLFEPYVTTRGIGEGMGLGLAISRKVMLDHGGDLELLETGENGTTFRLTLQAA